MFRDARIVGEYPYWIGEHIKNKLLKHWNSPNYRNKCATTQRNRALEKVETLHTHVVPLPLMSMLFVWYKP